MTVPVLFFMMRRREGAARQKSPLQPRLPDETQEGA